jgi:predicted RNA binding protein YcfA (HicA-like mRNA interferase family)
LAANNVTACGIIKLVSKLEKLLEKLQNQPPEARFSEIHWLLAEFGFLEVRSKGSHHHFKNSSGKIISVPKQKGKTVKLVYIKLVLKLLELEVSNEN